MYREEPYRYVAGDFWLICDECGRKLRNSAARMRWDGLMVCQNDWEPRHPSDLLHVARTDRQAVRNPRPRPEPVYLTPRADTVWMLEEDGTYMLDGDGNRMEEE